MDDEKDEIIEVVRNLPESLQDKLLDILKQQLFEALLETYQKAIEEVRKDKRKSRKARREKLKKLLTPVDLFNKAFCISLGLSKDGKPIREENPYRLRLPDGTSLYPFVELTIDLKSDLDISGLRYDEDSYQIPDVKRDRLGKCSIPGESVLNKQWGSREIWHKEITCKWNKSDGIDKLPFELQ